MHSLELARIIHLERERDIARELRVRAFKAAKAGADEAPFVPPPDGRPGRITHPRPLTPATGRDY